MDNRHFQPRVDDRGNSRGLLATFGVRDLLLLCLVAALLIALYLGTAKSTRLRLEMRQLAAVQRRPSAESSRDMEIFRLPVHADGMGWYRFYSQREMELVVSERVGKRTEKRAMLPLARPPNIFGIRFVQVGSGYEAVISHGIHQEKLTLENARLGNLIVHDRHWEAEAGTITIASSGPEDARHVVFQIRPTVGHRPGTE